MVNTEVIMCEVCERMFEEKWKFKADTKSHKLFPCEKCDKSFKYSETREMHIKATHEGLQIFCHFFP